MTNRAVRRENLFAPIGLGKFRRLFATRTARAQLFWLRDKSGIETVAAKVAGETSEVSAAEKDREAVNRNQPDRERFETHARLAFLPLDRRMHLMHVRVFAIIHSLADATLGRVLVHFFSSLAGAGEDAGAGEEAGAVTSFASFNS